MPANGADVRVGGRVVGARWRTAWRASGSTAAAKIRTTVPPDATSIDDAPGGTIDHRVALDHRRVVDRRAPSPSRRRGAGRRARRCASVVSVSPAVRRGLGDHHRLAARPPGACCPFRVASRRCRRRAAPGRSPISGCPVRPPRSPCSAGLAGPSGHRASRHRHTRRRLQASALVRHGGTSASARRRLPLGN